jgi:hypothetical protein
MASGRQIPHVWLRVYLLTWISISHKPAGWLLVTDASTIAYFQLLLYFLQFSVTSRASTSRNNPDFVLMGSMHEARKMKRPCFPPIHCKTTPPTSMKIVLGWMLHCKENEIWEIARNKFRKYMHPPTATATPIFYRAEKTGALNKNKTTTAGYKLTRCFYM